MWISGRKKIRRNFQRDSEVSKQLNSLGWRVLVIWECELNDISKLESIDRAIRKVIA
jgi:DNA mismatch endonuclease (patch repair protein)